MRCISTRVYSWQCLEAFHCLGLFVMSCVHMNAISWKDTMAERRLTHWGRFKIPLKFVPKGPISNIASLVQMMAWRRPGDNDGKFTDAYMRHSTSMSKYEGAKIFLFSFYSNGDWTNVIFCHMPFSSGNLFASSNCTDSYFTGVKAWTRNHVHCFTFGVIIHSCLNFNVCLASSAAEVKALMTNYI